MTPTQRRKTLDTCSATRRCRLRLGGLWAVRRHGNDAGPHQRLRQRAQAHATRRQTLSSSQRRRRRAGGDGSWRYEGLEVYVLPYARYAGVDCSGVTQSKDLNGGDAIPGTVEECARACANYEGPDGTCHGFAVYMSYGVQHVRAQGAGLALLGRRGRPVQRQHQCRHVRVHRRPPSAAHGPPVGGAGGERDDRRGRRRR